MTSTSSSAGAAGGALIALGAIVGAFGGAIAGQATAGFLVGTATGIGLATLMWLRTRR